MRLSSLTSSTPWRGLYNYTCVGKICLWFPDATTLFKNTEACVPRVQLALVLHDYSSGWMTGESHEESIPSWGKAHVFFEVVDETVWHHLQWHSGTLWGVHGHNSNVSNSFQDLAAPVTSDNFYGWSGQLNLIHFNFSQLQTVLLQVSSDLGFMWHLFPLHLETISHWFIPMTEWTQSAARIWDRDRVSLLGLC